MPAKEIVSRVKAGVEGLGIKRIDVAMLDLCEQPSPTPTFFFLLLQQSASHCPLNRYIAPGTRNCLEAQNN